MSLDHLDPQIRDGYRAARAGKPLETSPWKPETVGGHAWAVGWNLGSLPRWARWPFDALLWLRRR